MLSTGSATFPRGARPRRFAVLLDHLGSSYSDTVLDEVVEFAQSHSLEVVCLVQGITEFPPQRPVVSDLVDASWADAVLLASLGSQVGPQELRAYCERFGSLPICTTTVDCRDIPRLLVDNEPGMRAGVRHFVADHGYRRVAFVRGPERSAEAELRFRVYREVLAEHGIPFDPLLVSEPGHFIVRDGVEAVRLFLDERQVTPDAIVCVNDGVAMGVMQELSARRIDIPDHVAVMGFDDMDLSPYLESPLTTVRQPLREQTRRACDLLLALMTAAPHGPTAPLPAELVVRESCGCSRYDRGQGVISLAPSDALHLTAGSSVMADVSGAPSRRKLQEAFTADLANRGGAFRSKLAEGVDLLVRRGGDVGELQRTMTAIQQNVVDQLDPDTDSWALAVSLLHAARIRISSASERAPAMNQLQYEELSAQLSRINRALTSANTPAALAAALALHLPEYGIGSCYVCLYEEGPLPPEHAFLMLAWDSKRFIELPERGLRFPCAHLAPEGILPRHGRRDYVIEPLHREGALQGYVIWERGAPQGTVYHALQEQLSDALARIGVLRRIVHETGQREAAERERLEKEMDVARRIQLALAPHAPDASGLEVATVHSAAQQATGAYCDVVPVADGCWIGLGSISGQGLSTGLTLLTLQSLVGGLARFQPDDSPAAIVRVVREILGEAAHDPAHSPQRVRLTLVRYYRDGRLLFAGSRAGAMIRRAESGRVDWTLEPSAEADAAPPLDVLGELGEGDTLLLCGDGLNDVIVSIRRVGDPTRNAPA